MSLFPFELNPFIHKKTDCKIDLLTLIKLKLTDIGVQIVLEL